MNQLDLFQDLLELEMLRIENAELKKKLGIAEDKPVVKLSPDTIKELAEKLKKLDLDRLKPTNPLPIPYPTYPTYPDYPIRPHYFGDRYVPYPGDPYYYPPNVICKTTQGFTDS